MKFVLKHFDIPLLCFSADPSNANPNIHIEWVNDETKHLLPIGMDATEEGLWSWIKHRSIPQNRAFVNSLLSRCGLSINRPLGIIIACKGLSLNDCYWVVEEGFEGTFDKHNLYDNPISRVLSYLAFTGYGSSQNGYLGSSPEFTTGGMLPKRWSRECGKILLYKGGTSGFVNAGFEPYSEMYASFVAEKINANALCYWLSKKHGILSSVCELFTSKEYSFVPAGRLIQAGGFEAIQDKYFSLGEEFEASFNKMIIFDAIICNTDRHLGNFGVLVENKTNTIVKPAPLFDHGNSLFHGAYGEDWDSDEALEQYIQSLQPKLYDGFIRTAKGCLDDETRTRLRGLFEFEFATKGKYQLPKQRRKMIERQIQNRAKKLLN